MSSKKSLAARLLTRAFRTAKTDPIRKPAAKPPGTVGARIEELEDRSVPATLEVTGFGIGGWRSDDTRDIAGNDLVGVQLTNAPDAAVTPSAANDLAILQQLQLVSGPAGSLYGGAVKIDGTTENAGKTSFSTVNTTTGFAPASDLVDPSFSAEYQWYGEPNTTSRTMAFRIGVQSTQWAASQTGFTAARSGESSWDLILVYIPPTLNDFTWRTETVDATTGDWLLFRQAGNAFFPAPPAAKTLAGWNADPTWGPLLFGAGAKVTNVQFGLGSSQRNANAYVDYLQTSLLNGGDVIDFGSTSTVYVGTAPTFTIDIDTGPAGLSAGDQVTRTGATSVPGLTFGLNAFTTIQDGVNGMSDGGTVNVAAGTYTGDVDAVTGGKNVTFEAGSSPGLVTIAGNWTLNSGDVVNIDIEGPAPGTGYDQWVVTGTADLGGATANIFVGSTLFPATGSFDIVVANGTLTPSFTLGTQTPASIPGSFSYTGTKATYGITAPAIVYVNPAFTGTAFGADPDMG
ncbi:MAG TPA: hypothetical protein VD866_00855, partial [Urbifossiella sp.]|nr:hypothetical protein [Urbifossiella sp.]